MNRARANRVKASIDAEVESLVADDPGLTSPEYGHRLYQSRVKRWRNDDRMECNLTACESLRRLEGDGRVFRTDGKWWPVLEA